MIKRGTVTVESRFWGKIDICGADECWPWKGKLNGSGYGEILTSRPARKHIKSHRLAYELTYGPIPEGLCVCHSCDNPPCCNPAHLFLGTHLQNIADMIRKGRGSKGENVPRHKLTEEQVVYIMARLLTGREMHKEIATDFSVNERVIGKIWRGESWSYLFQ